jgi:uncharacterized protein DUF4279
MAPMEPEAENRRRPEYSASWRIHSDMLALADLRAALGEPTNGHDRGDLISPGRSDARRPHSFWSLGSGLPRTEPLEAHVGALLVAAEERRDALERLRPDVRTSFFCGVFRHDQWSPVEAAETVVFGCGFILTPDILRRLADLAMPFECDIY